MLWRLAYLSARPFADLVAVSFCRQRISVWVFRTIYDSRPVVYGKPVQTDLAKSVKSLSGSFGTRYWRYTIMKTEN